MDAVIAQNLTRIARERKAAEFVALMTELRAMPEYVDGREIGAEARFLRELQEIETRAKEGSTGHMVEVTAEPGKPAASRAVGLADELVELFKGARFDVRLLHPQGVIYAASGELGSRIKIYVSWFEVEAPQS